MTSETHPIASRLPDAAQRLGISRTTIYKAIKDGKLACHRLCGRVVILEDELQAFAKREAQPVREAA